MGLQTLCRFPRESPHPGPSPKSNRSYRCWKTFTFRLNTPKVKSIRKRKSYLNIQTSSACSQNQWLEKSSGSPKLQVLHISIGSCISLWRGFKGRAEPQHKSPTSWGSKERRGRAKQAQTATNTALSHTTQDELLLLLPAAPSTLARTAQLLHYPGVKPGLGTTTCPCTP